MAIRVQIRESDPLWAAMVERVVAADPQLALCPAGSLEVPDVVVLGEGRFDEQPPASAVVVALVEVHAGETAAQLRELGISHVLTRSTAAEIVAAELRAAARRR